MRTRAVVIFILVIFVLVGIVGFWYWQRNIYSKEVLKLEILSQEEVSAGEKIEYLVKLKNNGKVRLENPELVFQAPDHSILEGEEGLRVTQKIEDIYPGEERTYRFGARLFGKENDTLAAQALLTYQPKNLKALFESKTTFTTRIKFVPLTFEFDLPSRVEKGEAVDFTLNYFSNIDYLLENLRLKIEYPEGFEFLEASPPALDETEWSLPSLFRALGGRVEIKGRIEGEEGESKVFRAQLGMMKDGEFWLLKESSKAIKIVEPSLHISSLINNSQNYTANIGDILHYEIFFRNIGSRPVEKKFLIASLEGEFFDLETLKSNKGEFGSGDNTILWDWKNVPPLRFLGESEEGKVDFWVRVKEGVKSKVENPVLEVKINLAGVEKTFETKINSKAQLTQKVYFEQEFFPNSGSLPPEIGKTTQYVVLWQIKNSWNDLRNVKVKSVLPSGVKPTGKLFPEEAKFTYDSSSGEVIWNIGDIGAWQSFENSATSTLAFQVEFRPSPAQQGKTPLLIEEAEVLAEDVFTGDILQEKVSGVDTTLPDDDTVSEVLGRVR